MAKTILGLDIGYDNMKLALVRGRDVLGTAVVPMPKNLVRDGHIVSDETMGELIRKAMKENDLRTNAAAFAIPDETVFVRNVTMPAMTQDQLVYNLPFEFRDYITGEIREYLFDYAMLSGKASGSAQENPEESSGMDMLAVSVPKAYMEETRGIVRKAGLKLEVAAPAICSYIKLIRLYQEKTGIQGEDYCFLDLGYQAIRLHMFKGDEYVFTRVLDIGLSMLDEVLSDAFNIDIHLAHTYLMTNYENCQSREECVAAYSSIAMALLRVLNFYRYSNPDSNITNLWICGGGAMIKPLRDTIRDSLDLNVFSASEFVPGGGEIDACDSFVQAIGIAIDCANKESAVPAKGKKPVKRSINLAQIGVEKINKKLAAAGIILIVLAAGVFSKFLVADRLGAMFRASSEVRRLESELNAEYKKIESYGNLEEEYAHYTYAGMTKEELSLVDRAQIIDVIQRKTENMDSEISWSLTGNILILTVSGRDLEEINQLARRLEEDPLVNTCTVTTATKEDTQTKRPSAQVYGDNVVRANITVYLQNEEEGSK